ncbi:MAG: peptidylprolyl isomerase [Elusimicrobiota bacterium]|jgi:FKBP-type peptidyl-prolyl cis-trans isomerase 2|nr:peptidylprolyl isomerase [Elusimicrobiota bacterium]
MIKDGSKVAIDYTLTVDGQVVDSSKGRGPLEYESGAGQIIIGLEKALLGMKPGDKTTVEVEAKEAYGEVNKDAKRKVPKTSIQNAENLKVGDVVGASNGDQHFRAIISKIDEKEVELDFNHPLAGKKLTFEVAIVSVK